MSHPSPARPPAAVGPAAGRLAAGRLAAGLALAASFALAGCTGGGSNGSASSNTNVPPVPPPATTANLAVREVYVADAGLSDVPVVGVTAAGTLFALGSPAGLPAGSTAPHDIALDPTRLFALVTNSGGAPRLSSYRINADHSLPAAPTFSVTLPGLTALSHTALSAIQGPSGGVFVYVAGTGPNALYAFRLDTGTGALTAIPNAAPTTGIGVTQTPASLTAFNTGTSPFLLVGFGSPNAAAFAINADGTLSPPNVLQVGTTGPVLVAAPLALGTSTLSGTGNTAYAFDNGAHELYSYQVASNGRLTSLPDVAVPLTAASLIASPFGNALYLTQAGGPTIAALPVSGAGQPGGPVNTTVAGASLQAGATDGTTLGVVDPPNSRVLLYALNADGSVGAAQTPYGFSAGSDPVAVALGSQAVAFHRP